MRIFHLSSLHGPFVAQELLYPLRSSEHVSPFPFTQSDLYELHQPALCLIDAHSELYIWQGWNDLSDDELGVQLSNANLLAAGPKDIRFTTERRCALRTAIDYYHGKPQPPLIETDLRKNECFFPVQRKQVRRRWMCRAQSSTLVWRLSILSICFLNGLCIAKLDSRINWCVTLFLPMQRSIWRVLLFRKENLWTKKILSSMCSINYVENVTASMSFEHVRCLKVDRLCSFLFTTATNSFILGVDPSRIESYLSNDDFQVGFFSSRHFSLHKTLNLFLLERIPDDKRGILRFTLLETNESEKAVGFFLNINLIWCVINVHIRRTFLLLLRDVVVQAQSKKYETSLRFSVGEMLSACACVWSCYIFRSVLLFVQLLRIFPEYFSPLFDIFIFSRCLRMIFSTAKLIRVSTVSLSFVLFLFLFLFLRRLRTQKRYNKDRTWERSLPVTSDE